MLPFLIAAAVVVVISIQRSWRRRSTLFCSAFPSRARWPLSVQARWPRHEQLAELHRGRSRGSANGRSHSRSDCTAFQRSICFPPRTALQPS